MVAYLVREQPELHRFVFLEQRQGGRLELAAWERLLVRRLVLRCVAVAPLLLLLDLASWAQPDDYRPVVSPAMPELQELPVEQVAALDSVRILGREEQPVRPCLAAGLMACEVVVQGWATGVCFGALLLEPAERQVAPEVAAVLFEQAAVRTRSLLPRGVRELALPALEKWSA